MPDAIIIQQLADEARGGLDTKVEEHSRTPAEKQANTFHSEKGKTSRHERVAHRRAQDGQRLR